MTKLSIIVPVYNTEKYLRRCLNSIKNLKNTEIVIINDGSTDESEKIIQDYINEQKNVVYYKKDNTGIADTRNFGIEKAKGDYILFLDSDDYIDATLLKNLDKYVIEKVDVIKFKLQRVNEIGETLEKVTRCYF